MNLLPTDSSCQKNPVFVKTRECLWALEKAEGLCLSFQAARGGGGTTATLAALADFKTSYVIFIVSTPRVL